MAVIDIPLFYRDHLVDQDYQGIGERRELP